MVLAALFGVILFFDVALGGQTRTIELFTWIDTGDLQVAMGAALRHAERRSWWWW